METDPTSRTDPPPRRREQGEPNSGLVILAPNPFISFGLRLGRDEICAWIVSTGATLAAAALLRLFARDLSAAALAPILALVGPLAEKPGLFIYYFREAFRKYRSTPAGRRKPRRHYFAGAIRAGWPSLRADLLYHDPAYTVLLWLLLRVTGTQSVAGATLLAAAAFITAVALASSLEVLSIDLRYAFLLRKLRRAGFVTKSYYEAHFLVDPEGDPTFAPETIIDRLRERFRLPVRTSYSYRDLYLTRNSLAVYNGRRPYLRLRQRIGEDGEISKQALQVMYTRAKEVRSGTPGLYRCFATLKEKAGFDFGPDREMPWTIEAIPDPSVRAVARRLSDAAPDREVRFQRQVAMDHDGLFISVDIPPSAPHPAGAYWLEVKIRKDIEQLRTATEYIAWKLPVRATTRTKCDAMARSTIRAKIEAQ
ncbi:MAG: hypothetical protein P9M08_08520 [Candidatus Erginobacter occultus]|nr:hypothetical protein [Candidatus Erginobacter occultus]